MTNPTQNHSSLEHWVHTEIPHLVPAQDYWSEKEQIYYYQCKAAALFRKYLLCDRVPNITNKQEKLSDILGLCALTKNEGVWLAWQPHLEFLLTHPELNFSLITTLCDIVNLAPKGQGEEFYRRYKNKYANEPNLTHYAQVCDRLEVMLTNHDYLVSHKSELNAIIDAIEKFNHQEVSAQTLSQTFQEHHICLRELLTYAKEFVKIKKINNKIADKNIDLLTYETLYPFLKRFVKSSVELFLNVDHIVRFASNFFISEHLNFSTLCHYKNFMPQLLKKSSDRSIRDLGSKMSQNQTLCLSLQPLLLPPKHGFIYLSESIENYFLPYIEELPLEILNRHSVLLCSLSCDTLKNYLGQNFTHPLALNDHSSEELTHKVLKELKLKASSSMLPHWREKVEGKIEELTSSQEKKNISAAVASAAKLPTGHYKI